MIRFSIILLSAILASPMALAHHNWAAVFDVETDLEIQGVISAIEWRNPHVRLDVSVDQGTENETSWRIESGSVSNLTRMGLSKELLKVGETVRIAGYESRASDKGLFMNHLQLSDGRELVFLRGAEPRWKGEHIGNSDILHGKLIEQDISKRPTSIFAVWTTVFGAEGSHRALERDQIEWTERAEQILANNEKTMANPLVNCTPKGMPYAMSAPYPIQLIDQGEQIIIKMEEYDAMRVVQMTEVHDDTDVEASSLGYSTGRWVDDVLTVITTKMNYGLVPGTAPQGLEMQLHESFHLRADRNHLDYTQVIIDSEMRAAPSLEKKWFQWRPGEEIQPYSCSYDDS